MRTLILFLGGISLHSLAAQEGYVYDPDMISVRSAPVYFIVADDRREDPVADAEVDRTSFVLKLYRSYDISHSLRIFKEHSREAVQQAFEAGYNWDDNVFFQVSPTADQFSRDYLNPEADRWSWSVSHFNGFGSLSRIGLGNSPRMLEQNLEYVLLNEGGAVGMIGYTVYGMLPIQPDIPLGDDTFHTHTYGTIRDTEFPWVYSYQHGWWRLFGLDPEDLWIWTEDMGFLWTNEETYPYLFRLNDRAWLFFYEGDLRIGGRVRTTHRPFYNFKTEEWESFDAPPPYPEEP
jgi:hypothetical protein